MLPLHTMPDPSAFPLPWGADGDAWYEALQAALEGAVTAQRRGRFASRLEKPRPQPRWQPRERKTALRLARVHAPLFNPLLAAAKIRA